MDSNLLEPIIKVNEELAGFIIGKVMSGPEVYNPGGLTLMIDDCCVAEKTFL